MIKSEISKKYLSSINIDKVIINKLNKININTVGKLCKISRKKLIQFGFNAEEINHIVIKLQLEGFDLSIK